MINEASFKQSNHVVPNSIGRPASRIASELGINIEDTAAESLIVWSMRRRGEVRYGRWEVVSIIL